MNLHIDGKITITDYPDIVATIIRKKLTLPNPMYLMATRMAEKDARKRKMLYAISPTIKYYKEKDGQLIVGRGVSSFLQKYLSDNSIPFSYKIDRVSTPMSTTLPSRVVLRDYQIGRDNIVLKRKQGILKLGTAWGKSYFAFKLAERTQLKTLIICCKAELNELSKYKHDFKKLYGQEIGVIQGKTFVLKDVTVATASTLAMMDTKILRDKLGLVIVDEVHAAMSDKRIEAIQELNPERLYGMSGTPGRANGQSEALKFYYGEILIDEKLPQDDPEVHIYKTNCGAYGSEYYEMEEDIAKNPARNEFIRDIVTETLKSGRRILLLTKRIEHGKELERLIKPYCDNIYSLSSKDKADMRSELIQALRTEAKDFRVLIGTYGLFSTGVDLPALDTVILGMSIKVDGDYDATLVQSIGRILRLHDDKQKPLIIDLDDDKNKIMHRHHLSRLKAYKDRNYNIIKK